MPRVLFTEYLPWLKNVECGQIRMILAEPKKRRYSIETREDQTYDKDRVSEMKS